MNNNYGNKNTSNKYMWSDSMILDKVQEILNGKDIDDLELNEDELESIKNQLNNNLSFEELNESVCIIAENIEELKISSEDSIKTYIYKLIDYLNKTNLKCIIGQFNGIEFEVYADSKVDDVFKDYYSKYDKTYQITEMLSDLGLK